MDEQALRAVMAYAGVEVASEADFKRLQFEFQISLSGRQTLDQIDLHATLPIDAGPLVPWPAQEEESI